MADLLSSQDVCRDPAVQKAYASDPLCVQRGTFAGVSDMLLGVSGLVAAQSRLAHADALTGRSSRIEGLQELACQPPSPRGARHRRSRD